MIESSRFGLLAMKASSFAAAAIFTAICTAADLDITRSENAAGPQVRIEVHTSFDRGPRTVTVPRDLTIVDRQLPGRDSETTDGGTAEYYGLNGCDWGGLRAKLKQRLEQGTRSTLIFIMRHYVNDSTAGLKRRLESAFNETNPGPVQFIGYGGHAGMSLSEQEKQALRGGQQVQKPSSAPFGDSCVVTASDMQRLLESVILIFEAYTGASRNTP